jgi:hypothetical protein
MNKEEKERLKKWNELTQFIAMNGGWVTSVPGKVMRIELPVWRSDL